MALLFKMTRAVLSYVQIGGIPKVPVWGESLVF